MTPESPRGSGPGSDPRKDPRKDRREEPREDPQNAPRPDAEDGPDHGERLTFEIQRQPDDVTCGPTCLHAVYRYFEDDISFSEVLDGVRRLDHGGTLAVLLAEHALQRGYISTILTWNLQVFDPTWFRPGARPLRENLLRRAEQLEDERRKQNIAAYVEFLDAGGRIELRELDAALLRRYLQRGLPLLTGLSATFLYREAREHPDTGKVDDIGGEPAGHFVVLTGQNAAQRQVLVSDPLYPNPLAATHTYPVPVTRLIGAIYLGVLTHDANLLVIEPRAKSR